MKRIISILFILTAATSCSDVLNKEPLDLINDAVVWSDEILADSYLTQIYGEMQFITQDVYGISMYTPPTILAKDWFDRCMSINLSDEARDQWVYSNMKYVVLTEMGGRWELWPYDLIRRQNYFIEKMESVGLSEEFRVSKSAEARFLRAFTYFSMAKRYGGVPLITKVQNLGEDPEEEIYAPRAKEAEVYDFVISEVDEILDILPDVVPAADKGRPSKYAALALKSKAALFAASSAAFGEDQPDGLAGIPTQEAAKYWQICYDAANAIIQSGRHALYKKYWSDNYNDQVSNYQNLFLDEAIDNLEPIFVKQFNGAWPLIGHGWDLFQCPKGYNPWGGGNQSAVYLDMVESYEYVDGTPGNLDYAELESRLWTMDELWKDKDPRFVASIYTQDTPWMGNKLQFYHGIIKEDGSIQESESYNGILATGTSYNQWTGFGVLKYLDPTYAVPDNNASDTDLMLFRYAEILLNYAEAALELGKASDALWAVNEIRKRAGIAELTDIDREKIRHERKIELAFENHRYWDLRRWREAETVLTGNFKGLRFILDYVTGMFRIVVLDAHGTGEIPLFGKNQYYFPITPGRIANNPNLIENPYY